MGQKTETRLEYTLCENTFDAIPAIIVAAGSSSRMAGVNKQFLEINGIPVIVKTLLAFEQSSAVRNIILVSKAEDIFKLQLLAEQYNISKLSDIVCGGESRQESVIKGIERLDINTEAVLIHDGARPFASDSIIRSVAEALKANLAVSCAVKVKDTVKEISANGFVEKTLDREKLVAVQTPQGVRLKEYRKAIADIPNIASFTDDTSIMEAAGHKVFIVDGSYSNIKITTPEDIFIAERFSEREE